MNTLFRRLLFPSSVSVTRLQQSLSLRMEHTASNDADNSYKFETLAVTKPRAFVFHVEMNRPNKMNAMNLAFWREIRVCFELLADDADCRAVVLSGAGKMFTAGLDFMEMANLAGLASTDDVARKAKQMKKLVTEFQQSFTSIEQCPKPVIAAIHNGCIGGGTSMITACDIRYCTTDAWFQIKEVEIGLSADVGVLQRMQKIVGNDSLMRELAYTVRKMYSDEAFQFGLVSRIFPNKEMMMNTVFETAAIIASKSPVAVQGTKIHLNYSRDHSVLEGLDYQANWNMTMLQSEDLVKAATAVVTNRNGSSPPQFSKL